MSLRHLMATSRYEIWGSRQRANESHPEGLVLGELGRELTTAAAGTSRPTTAADPISNRSANSAHARRSASSTASCSHAHGVTGARDG